MPISAKQLNFSDISTEFDKFYRKNQNNLLDLLDQFTNVCDFIPFSFYQKYYFHFKCDISTNALGVVRNVNFYDIHNNLCKDLRSQDIKDAYDAKSLIPTLEAFFQLHPNFSYKYFLGDAEFDADDNYAYV